MEKKDILEKLDIVPDKKEYLELKKEADSLINKIKGSLNKNRIEADVFLGGSFAKKTLVKKDNYDIDIFVRFDWRYESLTEELEKVIKEVSKDIKIKAERLHGSRDYFRFKKENIIFEIIPVSKIKKPKEARNVTDLSYFHVNYVKKNIDEKIAREIIIAKTFCKANGVYGAESYIQGFSGYALECLIIYYKNFEKMLRSLLKVKDRIILDPSRAYKNTDEILINLNPSKLNGPIVLVDPTWRERNVLAALSNSTFERFKIAAAEYLKDPSLAFFEDKENGPEEIEDEAKKENLEFLHICLETDKQAGDIAGTKLKKFANFLISEINLYFKIKRSEFVYDERQEAGLFLSLESKKEIYKIGPPTKMKEACIAFKKNNREVFEKEGFLHSKVKIDFTAEQFVQRWIKKYLKKIKEMDITSIKIE